MIRAAVAAFALAVAPRARAATGMWTMAFSALVAELAQEGLDK